MLKTINLYLNGAVAQLEERFNGIEAIEYTNLNTNKMLLKVFMQVIRIKNIYLCFN